MPLSEILIEPSAQQRRLSLRVLCGFAAGGFLDTWGIQSVKNSANAILNIILGVNPITLGVVFGGTRLWDAFLDPVMGSITDNTKSRWGRRRPYIVAGTLMCALTFPFLWWVPPGASAAAQAVWLGVAAFPFYTA